MNVEKLSEAPFHPLLPAGRQMWSAAGDIRAVLYTDSINDEQTCRDDLWLATTDAINASTEEAMQHAYAEGRKDEAQELSSDAMVLRLDDLMRRMREEQHEVTYADLLNIRGAK